MVLSGEPRKISPLTPPGIDPGTVVVVVVEVTVAVVGAVTVAVLVVAVVVVVIIVIYYVTNRPGSVVGIATAYGLDGPGIESSCGEIFRTSPDRP